MVQGEAIEDDLMSPYVRFSWFVLVFKVNIVSATGKSQWKQNQDVADLLAKKVNRLCVKKNQESRKQLQRDLPDGPPWTPTSQMMEQQQLASGRKNRSVLHKA